MKNTLILAIAILAGCGHVSRSASGRTTTSYRGGANGVVSVMEASADLTANDASLDICREAIVQERSCMAFDSRTGQPMVIVGGGSVPYGYFGQSSALSAAAAIGQAERLRIENARLRQDVSILTGGE